MRKSGIFIFLTCLLCGCQPQVSDLPIDDFEGDINSLTVDFGAAKGSSLNVEAATDVKFSGAQSLKLSYDLQQSGYMWVARGYKLDVQGAAAWLIAPDKINWPRYNALSIAVFGSNSGGVFALDIKDAGGEMWRFLIDDDFKGWKEVFCPFKEFFVRKDWQPNTAFKNEVLDFPVMSFQFEPRLPGKGVVYLDYVKLTKVKE